METIYLQRQNEDIPWGFRLQGGADFKLPLTVQRVTSGSIAANGVCAGDVIARIGEAETASMSHTQAMQAIKKSGNVLQLGISRSGGMNGYSPSVPAISQQPASHPYSSTTPSANPSFQSPDFSMHDLYEDLNGVQAAPQPDPYTRYHPDNTIPNQPLNQFETRNSFPDSFENSYNSNDSWPRPGPAYDHGPAYSPAIAGSMATPQMIVSDNDSWKQPGPTFDQSPAYTSSPAGSMATPQLVVSNGEAWRNETSNGPQCSPAPPPPPPPPMNVSPTWNNQNGGNSFKKPATRLEQQISGDYPFGVPPVMYGSDFESPATPGGDLSSGIGTDYGDYDSSAYSSEMSPQQPTSPPQQRMPDAILNMAAKGEASKKPFAYVADINDIREARDKVKKKTNTSSLPRYQHMLNMPQFEDPPRARGLPKTPPVAAQPNSQDSGEAVVANLQFNSPLQLYSSDNVVEALKGQSGGVVKDVIGLQKKEKNDITQSAVYKMIHGLDQQKPKPVVSFVESRPPERDHVGGSEIDTTSIRHVAEDDPDQVGQYEQKSIRYTGRNIPSKSFRLLQSMTGGGDSTPPPVSRHIREPSSDDELRFSGLNKTGRDRAIPSKTFQLLHQKTATLPDGGGHGSGGEEGGSEIDRTSIRHNILGVPEEPGDYDQTSIRYTGKNIPSKSFRMLQSMTGGPGADDSPTSGSPVTVQGGRRQQVRKQQPAHVQHRPEPEGEKQNPDDVVDIRYVGGSIPSQSFRMLQQFVGTSNSDGTDGSAGPTTGGSTGDTLPSSEGRRVKVVRLRQQSSMEHTGSTEF